MRLGSGGTPADSLAHCGKPVAGSHARSLGLTDIASGWREAVAMIVRERTLVIESVEGRRRELKHAQQEQN